ncbi:MAG: serine dehydratase subunit alpha family protein [Ruminococcaceae bacterium]|nr:serine dehydratase subunit alpha family protein [Oscillospiraceae bacterium]
MLSENTVKAYTDILRSELVPAMGCTEPIAIAYAAAILRDALGERPTELHLALSGNIIKNVKSVIVPATGGMHGIAAAVAAGIVSARPDRRLEVLCALTDADIPDIADVVKTTPLDISELDTELAFELDLIGCTDKKTARVRVMERHTNIVSVTADDKDLTEKYRDGETDTPTYDAEREALTVESIVEFADTVDLSELKPYIKRQLELNLAIAKEGLTGKYGAAIGATILSSEATLRDRAKAYAAAGSDARMSGCELPVCIISGSGNQGMTASLPVAIYADAWGVPEEKLIRAMIVSDLITVHQKTGIGCLSAYCGAISAGCGCGCGIAYLAGGGFYEIAHTLVNSIAILSGTICDGAKPSCAAKIAMAVEAGILGYEMMRSGHQFYGGDGIVTKGVENTIKNIGKLARDGMSETDKQIIKIMLEDKTGG